MWCIMLPSFAKALHLNPDVIEVIRQAALLHDVGKIGIPETILNKPAKLTDEEYEVIKGQWKLPSVSSAICRLWIM